MPGSSWIFVKASWKGGTTFVIENRSGCRSTISALGPSGGEHRHFTPVDTFIASLASCAGTHVVLLLRDRGVAIRSLTVKAECILETTEPRSFGKIHLIFLVSGDGDEETVRQEVHRSVTLLCPIAVTVGRAAELTWEAQVTRDPRG